MKIPVLTYHSMNIHGNDYHNNDHIALMQDLQQIHSMGKQVVPLLWIVKWLLGEWDHPSLAQAVAISCDDGSWFDYYDMTHPSFGVQKSFFNLLVDFKKMLPLDQQTYFQATAFVIASPAVRSELDQKCMIGKGWWSDEWWECAEQSQIMTIGNHSWDHNHPQLDVVCQREQKKGAFHYIDTYEDGYAQIVLASRYIAEKIAQPPKLFAYPYGETSDYLVEEFFPNYKGTHQLLAAFSTEPAAVTQDSNIWKLPRYVCGRDWKSSIELQTILLN